MSLHKHVHKHTLRLWQQYKVVCIASFDQLSFEVNCALIESSCKLSTCSSEFESFYIPANKPEIQNNAEVMASSDNTPATSIILYGEEYSILSVPSETSALVKLEKEELVGTNTLCLKTLVTDLGRVGEFIKIAYNATLSAGISGDESIHKLHLQVRSLGSGITDLCGLSAVTVSNFRSTTRTILQELKGAYQYLLDGFEDMAIDCMENLSTLAKKMADAAYKLQLEIKAQEEKVTKALDDSKTAQFMEEKEIKRLEDMRERRKRQIEDLSKEIEELVKSETKVKKERMDLEEKELDEIKNIKTGALEAIGNFVLPGAGTRLFGNHKKDAIQRKSMYRENVVAKQEEERKIHEDRKTYIQQQQEFISDMKSCETDESNAAEAVKFLHAASSALQELEVVMKRAAIFWMKLHHHCKNLADDSVKDRIEKGMKYPEERRIKFWTSSSFKEQAVSYYAKWAALHSMCHEYMGHIEQTQQQLYSYLRENPTRDQARQNLPALIAKYESSLSEEQKEISEQMKKASDIDLAEN